MPPQPDGRNRRAGQLPQRKPFLPPTPPQPHFPSPYARPGVAPAWARRIAMSDGAGIATFVYAPTGDLHALDAPERPPILMLHGNGEEHGIFGPTIDAVVDAGYAVVAIDARGQGRSTRGTARLSYELMADDALAVLDMLGVEHAHVLGFSDGGIEALLLARDHPARVASLVALGANLTPDGVMDDPEWDLEGTIAAHRTWSASWGEQEQESTDSPGTAPVDTSLLTPTPTEAAATAELLQLMLDEPHIDAASLGAITCPATIMVGEFDCIEERETAAIVASIPRARLVVVPEAGHTLPKHEPEAVTRELLATVRRGERNC